MSATNPIVIHQDTIQFEQQWRYYDIADLEGKQETYEGGEQQNYANMSRIANGKGKYLVIAIFNGMWWVPKGVITEHDWNEAYGLYSAGHFIKMRVYFVDKSVKGTM